MQDSFPRQSTMVLHIPHSYLVPDLGLTEAALKPGTWTRQAADARGAAVCLQGSGPLGTQGCAQTWERVSVLVL